jgi:sterol 3beta-glucosyltransferase
MMAPGGLRFCVVAGGTRGDVEPLTEVVRGLVNEGHEVRFIANALYQDAIEGCGATWVDDGSQDPRQVMAAEAAESGQWTRPPNRLKRLIFGWKHMGPSLDSLRRLATQMQGADVVLYNAMSSPAYLVACAASVPAINLSVSAHLPTRDHAKPMGPIWQHRHQLPALYNLGVPWLYGLFAWSADRKWLRPWCAELGIRSPGLSEWTLQPKAWGLSGFSSRLLPRPTDWPANREVTGFWFSQQTCRLAASALDRPVVHPPSKVYLYFGSNSVGEDPVARDIILPVLKELGLETVDASGMKQDDGRKRDYREILQTSEIVIHHGGVGTSGLVAQFGCVSVIVPAFGEQRFWAARMERLGLCPRVIPRLELDRDGFRATMKSVLQDSGYVQRARTFGRELLAEKGAEKASRRILEISAEAQGQC